MEIDDALILKLEKLAQLQLSDQERQEVKKDLEKIFDMFGTLSGLEATGVEPFTHFVTGKDQGREDQVLEHQNLEVTLANAPAAEGDFFIVPKMIH